MTLGMTQTNWWTTSDVSTFISSGLETASEVSPTASPDTQVSETGSSLYYSGSYASGSSAGVSTTVFTSPFPVTTITNSATIFTSYSDLIGTKTFTNSFNMSLPSDTALSDEATPSVQFAASSQINPTCVGNGLDAAADGLLASLVIPSAIGLIIWLIFAALRPRFRKVYGLREWFVHQDIRPKPLSDSIFAFLFPPVPLVPSIPSNVSDAGKSIRTDAALFPSDDQLSQRTLWTCFLICLGWTFLGLAGALPLYLVSTPCHSELPSPSLYGGGYNMLQDLSLSRLLRLLDTGNISTANLAIMLKRADATDSQNFRIRIIVLTALTLVLALLPALWKILREFNRLVAYRERWLDIMCEGKDIGWLSARYAPGFVGWGEQRLKDFILKAGLSLSFDHNSSRDRNATRTRSSGRRGRSGETEPLNADHDGRPEVDIETLFSISNTEQLADLILRREEILGNLEIAETQYITCFRLTTPDPSLADWVPPSAEDLTRPHISRPRPLLGSRRRNPAFAASSLAPTSFVAPSTYYKIRGVHGISGGRFSDIKEDHATFADSITSPIIGDRFQEDNRRSQGSSFFGLGNYFRANRSDELGMIRSRDELSMLTPIPPPPDPRKYGPNWLDSSDVTGSYDVDKPLPPVEEEWVDVLQEQPGKYIASEPNGNPAAGPSSSRQRPKREQPVSAGKRETFPFRKKDTHEKQDIPPPHLRIQPSGPFVRPQDGVDFDYLGDIYRDITEWRTKLKDINTQISNAQFTCYKDIAEGARMKGWLMVGRGLRHIPGIQIIEGRAKEDVRWDVLQNERTSLDTWVMTATIIIAVILLAAGLTAASGLALSNAPDFAHYITFLQPVTTAGTLPSGIVTVWVPAVIATVFISLTLALVHWVSNVRGTVSYSGGQLMTFKITFYVLVSVAVIWILTIGALLFALHAFSGDLDKATTVAKGSVYMTVFALSIVLQIAIIFPGLLLLQPLRLWSVIRNERYAITPRQHFRAMYPKPYDATFATGACILGIIFASTFSLIFPLIGPAVVILLFLTLIAHRFLVGYVYGRTLSQTGGLIQIWLLCRVGTLLAFQPILLGLIFLANEIWIEGGVLIGTGVIVILFVEAYTSWRTRQPGRRSLSIVTQNSLDTFISRASQTRRLVVDEEESSQKSGSGVRRTRSSMASVLEMMSVTLAVMPSSSTTRGSVPLQTENLNDLTATERAARTHPEAPPRLPPLSFSDHEEDTAGILYAPELIAPPPIIWLPNDSAGVARSEAVDLQKYHDLRVTLDVRVTDDVMLQRPTPSGVRGQW
ncbi:uncharacterized protein EV420DRAFT_1637605 [Desarmillaria tabescens]|uniref:CSC1/OSCA1-like 7TM region domain-containing protein n=1 Tax=Armillaria tabescens TaxID=1929756 RepID=A0AA39NGZ9_ARMTA|nr:uncharacterized protein EV420DRAFT_1637605 [Desarmillaria tabescens]KAK0465471.1 hypothetical protein EV420DRAFT_1637605 [Desarmillaria tabescens]